LRTIGITGGIGSGKSEVARMLAQKAGVRVIRADDVAKELMEGRPELRDALVREFGDRVFDEAGRLDRAWLASRVFGDDNAVGRLNAIVHPAVREALREEIEAARGAGVRLLVYEAALLHEMRTDELVDLVVLVDAPLASRVDRVVARDGATREQVEARAEHQLDPAEFRLKADIVIENDAGLEELHRRVDALYEQLATTARGS
jgi:dephospho-CoA kinase